jgi:hypothetical protein
MLEPLRKAWRDFLAAVDEGRNCKDETSLCRVGTLLETRAVKMARWHLLELQATIDKINPQNTPDAEPAYLSAVERRIEEWLRDINVNWFRQLRSQSGTVPSARNFGANTYHVSRVIDNNFRALVQSPKAVAGEPEPEAVPVPVEPVAAASAHAQGGKPTRKPTIDALMFDVMFNNLESHGWTCRQWATEIDRDYRRVQESKTFKQLEVAREQLRVEKASDRRRRTKTARK